MTSHVLDAEHHRPHSSSPPKAHDAMRFVAPLGRLLFVAIFLMSGPNHFSKGAIGYAAGNGVPFPDLLVPASGVLAVIGGLSILLGYYARIGAWLLVLFLVPVTLMMHNFWAVPDPHAAMTQQAMFMKNVSIMGACLLIAYFGAGPFSIDARRGAA
jgi:putative oxidoreductase